jgi:hypothetical protein
MQAKFTFSPGFLPIKKEGMAEAAEIMAELLRNSLREF